MHSIFRVHPAVTKPSLIPEPLLLVEQIRPTTSQIDNLRTTIPIFFQTCTFETVECVTQSFAATHNTLVLVVAKAALVADAGESRRSDVAVADGAFSVTFVAETSDCYASGLAAHD